MLVLTLAVAAIAGGPTLALSGSCPGPITIEVTGVTPGGRVGLLRGSGVGGDRFASGPCAGVASGLTGPSLVRVVEDEDSDGRVRLTPEVGPGVCGVTVQAVDGATCAGSGTATLGGVGGDVLYAHEGRGGSGGLFRLDLSTGRVTPVGGRHPGMTGMTFDGSGALRGVTATGAFVGLPSEALFEIDTATGGTDEGCYLAESRWSGLAWNPADEALYGWSNEREALFRIDPGTCAAEPVFRGARGFAHCMTFDSTGALYRVAGADVSRVDPVTGAETPLVRLPGLPEEGGGRGCTASGRQLYIAYGADLVEVDLDTLRATSLGRLLPTNVDALAAPW